MIKSRFVFNGPLILLAFLVLLIQPGCKQYQKPAKKDPYTNWQIKAEQSKGFSPYEKKRIRPATEKVSTKPAVSPRPEKPLPNKKITLKMHQVDIAVLLRTLARSVDINIMMGADIKSKISVNLNQTPWDKAFYSVLKTSGLSFRWEDDIIRIITPEDKSRELRQLETEQQIAAKKYEMEIAEPLLTKVIDINYADAPKLKQNLENFLSEQKDGKSHGVVLVDKHTNSLIIQAMKSDLERIVSLIDELDKPTPQILIEAHIVETTSQTARELGVQWGGLYAGSSHWVTPDPASGMTSASAGGAATPDSGFMSNFPADLSGAALAGAGLNLGLLAQDGDSLLAIQLTALEQEGKLNILSKPSITTLDSQTAIIESGDEVPYQTVDDRKVNIEYKSAVLRLEVTPHVIEGEILKLKIYTTKDELDFTRTVSGNPTVVTKKAETNVILFDGQTTVIGGLNKQTTQDGDYGIPGLKDIPLLGYLFKGESDTSKMEDVLIFITPHILMPKQIQ